MSLKSFTSRVLTACVAMALIATSNSFAQTAVDDSKSTDESVVRVLLNEDGSISGRVFAMVDSEEAPMVAKVSLAADGKMVASSDTDMIGNFSFSDVEPGTYTMVGVSGEYVGDQVVVVAPKSTDVVEGEGVYTSLALQVAPLDSGYAGSTFVGVPMDSYAAPMASYSDYGSSYAAGGGVVRGGPSLRRLLLIGGAVAIPVALSGDNDMASPDE